MFRRQSLDRAGLFMNVNKIVTGHNADDIAETILMNILRGDIGRLQRCTSITTGSDGAVPRCKPFKYTYEKEIVMYAYFKKLDYFSTECIYSPNAYRGYARAFIKDLESIRARSIIDIIHSGENLAIKKEAKMPVQGICERCGYISSMNICKACNLLEGLNKGLPKLGIGKTSRLRRQFNLTPTYSLNSSMSTLSLKSSSLSLANQCDSEGGGCSTEACDKQTGCCGSNKTFAQKSNLNVGKPLDVIEDCDMDTTTSSRETKEINNNGSVNLDF